MEARERDTSVEARERDITTKLEGENSCVQKIAFQVGKRVPKHGFEPPFWTHCACVNYLLATLKRIRTQSDWTNVPNLRRSPLCSKKVHPMKAPGKKIMLFKGAAGSNVKHCF